MPDVYVNAMANRRFPGDSDEDGDTGSSTDALPGWSSSSGSLSDNLVFATVDSPRRRFILEALKEEGGEADIDELVEDVAAIERQSEGFEPDGDHREILETIYDADLPELSDIDVVDLDESEGTVRLGQYADELDIEELTSDTD